jgi:hypothetical protein
MSVIHYPPKSYEKCTKSQLVTVAIALENQRDKALARVRELEAKLETMITPTEMD